MFCVVNFHDFANVKRGHQHQQKVFQKINKYIYINKSVLSYIVYS
jgi:hypothetical protein